MSSMLTAQLILPTLRRQARREEVIAPLPGGLDELLIDGLWPDQPTVAPKKRVQGQSNELAQTQEAIVRSRVAGRRTRVVAQGADKPVGTHGLRPKQLDAAVLLIGGMIAKDVAQALGVAEETVSRWRARREFQEVMQGLLQERYDATRMAMVSLAQDAVEELRCLIHGSSDMTRLRAIELVLGRLAEMRT